ncbi:hypothetical protein SESBI_16739 [Sesbania bispinosa]|nr:hypothetical protein SESBI_16739 [Sesbania bispinosa]
MKEEHVIHIQWRRNMFESNRSKTVNHSEAVEPEKGKSQEKSMSPRYHMER